MANANTFAGFQNLPAVTVTYTTTETGYVIPAVGTYPSLPSPAQLVTNWLVVPALSGDITGGILDYGRPFRVRVNGEVKTAQTENLTVKLYQVTAANFATGVTATTNGTNISSTGATAVGTGGAKQNFLLDTILMWDSQSKSLNGWYYSQVGNASFGAITKITTVASLNENDLNFFPTFTFGTGTSDILGPLDITIDRY